MTAAATPALRAEGVYASLGQAVELHGIDLVLPAGRWSAIVGPNGAGKSTLLRVMAGLLAHDGTVRLLGEPMARMPGRARAQRLAWLGQGGAGEGSADDLMVYDVAMLGRLPHQRWLAGPGTGASGRSASSRAASVSACCWRAPWRSRPRCC
jgi:iron complex transport system ATP-binding protein